MKTKRRVVDILPFQSGKWRVKIRGAKRATKIFEDKDEALAFAKDLARGGELGQVVVRKGNGRIQVEYTYGQDPEGSAG